MVELLINISLFVAAGMLSALVFWMVILLFRSRLFVKKHSHKKINEALKYHDLLRVADRAAKVGSGLSSMILAFSSIEALLNDLLNQQPGGGVHVKDFNEKIKRAESLGVLDHLTAEDIRRLANIRRSIVHGSKPKDLEKNYSEEKIQKYLSDTHRVIDAIEASSPVAKVQ